MKCGCDAVQHYKCRPIYKCKRCSKQFSATSGTPWQRRKIQFRKLMYLIACVVQNVQAKSVLSISDDIGTQYKAVLLWVHKLRAEIAKKALEQKLSGEVEMDGAFFGGFIRPKNQAKTRKDLRKIPYRDNDRALCVVVARQRGGGVVTCVAKNEGDAQKFLKSVLTPGTVLFTDKAPHWSSFRAKFKLFQVNHKHTYSTPEACTNQAETLWAQMRVMERVHRHISQNYLDLYAAEAAWKLTKNKQPKGAAFADLMGWMSRSGPSSLAGYFQGRKRLCPLVQLDGTTKGWKPAPRKGRAAFVTKDGTGWVEYKPRRALSMTWREGFEFMTADAFMDNPSAVPDGSGVYAVFLRYGQALLDASGFIADPAVPAWWHDGAVHVYTGESYGLQSRLATHLSGSVESSNLRETLLALALGASGASSAPYIGEDRIQTETTLTEWLRENAVIGFRRCGYIKDVETAILDATASPFNLVRNNATAYIDTLQGFRRIFRDLTSLEWKAPEPVPRTRQRR